MRLGIDEEVKESGLRSTIQSRNDPECTEETFLFQRRKKKSSVTNDEATEMALIQTILGEHAPEDVLLKCLIQASFDIATAINLYLEGQVTTKVDVTKAVRSGMPITLHQASTTALHPSPSALNQDLIPGVLARHESFATMTSGQSMYDTITGSNEKYRVLRLRKRSSASSSVNRNDDAHHHRHQYFRNGDTVSMDIHGLWLKHSRGLPFGPAGVRCHWKSPNASLRNQFMIQGLAPGAWLTIDSAFYLQSRASPSCELALATSSSCDEAPVQSPFHRSGLTLVETKSLQSRLWFVPQFTPRALDAIPRSLEDLDEIEATHESSSSLEESKIDQMADIVPNESRLVLAQYLNGADGSVEIALEHYFMSTTSALPAPAARDKALSSLPHAEVSDHRHQLLIPMPAPMIFSPHEQAVLDHPKKSKDREELHTVYEPVDSLESDQERAHSSIFNTKEGQLRLNLESFEMLSVLGRGSFGAVMMVRYKSDSRVFAMKIIRKDSQDKVNIQAERQILQQVQHPFVSALVFAFQTPGRLYLGMKYYAAGDLFYHLNENGRFPLEQARLYAAELVSAVSYLHSLNILYRDLKPSNIMIDQAGHLGIIDFGLSKQDIKSHSDGVKTLSGTAEYVAPEALVQYEDGSRNYGKAYDWWSLGIVLFEMLVGQSPFYHENERQMLDNIVHAQIQFPPDMNADAQSLILGFLVRDPSTRLGSSNASEIKDHAFFRTIDWARLERRELEPIWKPYLSSETDTRYVDPEFIKEGMPSMIVIDPTATTTTNRSTATTLASHRPALSQQHTAKKNNRFSQFSFDFRT